MFGPVGPAVGLALLSGADVLVVSAIMGMTGRRTGPGWLLPVVFGGFHLAFTLLGWVGGAHAQWGWYGFWGAVVLLVVLAAHALRSEHRAVCQGAGMSILLLIAFLTGIDGMAAGFAGACRRIPLPVSAAAGGGCAAGLSLLGLYVGRWAGKPIGTDAPEAINKGD